MINLFNKLFQLKTPPPLFDIDTYIFLSDKDAKRVREEYAKQIMGYCAKQILINISVLFAGVLIVVSLIVGTMSYNKGFTDNQAYAPDGSQIVLITKSGSKYHGRTCRYIENGIEISENRAIMQGYSPCSVCTP